MPLAYMQGGSVSVGNKAQCLAYDLLFLWIKVLEDVILGADDGQGDGEGVEEVLVLCVREECVLVNFHSQSLTFSDPTLQCRLPTQFTFYDLCNLKWLIPALEVMLSLCSW